MPEETYRLEQSEYEQKLRAKHKRKTSHSIERLVMRRRLSFEDNLIAGNVVYWSYNVCKDCDWWCLGRVSMQQESLQLELKLIGGDQ